MNHVVQCDSLDRTLAALADPTRRAAIERLGQGSASITDLAAPSGISLTGMKKHVRVLENAGLVTTTKVGRARRCELSRRSLSDVEEWMTSYRQMVEDRLDRLGELLEQPNEETKR